MRATGIAGHAMRACLSGVFAQDAETILACRYSMPRLFVADA